MTINHDDLVAWSIHAANVLQDIIDSAQAATEEPFADTECRDLRDLLTLHDRIMRGMPLWQKQLVESGLRETDSFLNLGDGAET